MSKQIVKGIRKYIPVFQDAKDKDMNEADCVTRIIKFLEDVLGYDVLKDITKEFQIKDRYVDLAAKIDNKIKFYIEVKSSNTKLKEGHIYQAESYASQSGIPWVVLTNGAEWQLYHLVFDKTGIDHSVFFSIDLINGDIEQNADELYYLSKDAFKKDEIEDYRRKKESLSAGPLIKALFHEDTLTSIKRELRRMSNILFDEDDVLENVRKLLKDEVLSQYGEMIKIRRKRKSRIKSDEESSVTEQKEISTADTQTNEQQKEETPKQPE